MKKRLIESHKEFLRMICVLSEIVSCNYKEIEELKKQIEQLKTEFEKLESKNV